MRFTYGEIKTTINGKTTNTKSATDSTATKPYNTLVINSNATHDLFTKKMGATWRFFFFRPKERDPSHMHDQIGHVISP